MAEVVRICVGAEADVRHVVPMLKSDNPPQGSGSASSAAVRRKARGVMVGESMREGAL